MTTERSEVIYQELQQLHIQERFTRLGSAENEQIREQIHVKCAEWYAATGRSARVNVELW